MTIHHYIDSRSATNPKTPPSPTSIPTLALLSVPLLQVAAGNDVPAPVLITTPAVFATARVCVGALFVAVHQSRVLQFGVGPGVAEQEDTPADHLGRP